jgi:hypothetical protein
MKVEEEVLCVLSVPSVSVFISGPRKGPRREQHGNRSDIRTPDLINTETRRHRGHRELHPSAFILHPYQGDVPTTRPTTQCAVSSHLRTKEV